MWRHAQKPDFVFRRNGRVHLNRPGGASVQSTTGSRGVRISGTNAGYCTCRDSVKGTGYPLNSPVSPSLPLPDVTVCHHISTGLYQATSRNFPIERRQLHLGRSLQCRMFWPWHLIGQSTGLLWQPLKFVLEGILGNLAGTVGILCC